MQAGEMKADEIEADDLLRVVGGIVADCPDPAFLVDMEGRIKAWNGPACEFFGVPSWQASARSCALVVRGYTPYGEPFCKPDCPFRDQLRHGEAPADAEIVVMTGRLPSSRRPARVHHLPVMHPDAGAIGILHVLHALEDPAWFWTGTSDD